MEHVTIEVDTSHETTVDLTEEVLAFCRRSAGGRDGLLHVFAPHATAGLALIETGSGSEEDLEALLGRLLPREERYRHRHGSPGHGADHLLPAIVAPHLSIPIDAGRPALGTWQRIVLVDLNRDNPVRRVRFSFLAG